MTLPESTRIKGLQTGKPAWARDRDMNLVCLSCGCIGLRYRNRSHLCRACFRQVPGRLKVYGGEAVKGLFMRFAPSPRDLDRLIERLRVSDLAGAAQVFGVTTAELVAILLPDVAVANDDDEAPLPPQ